MKSRGIALLMGFSLWLCPLFARGQMFNVTFLHTPPARTLVDRDLQVTGNIIGADQVSIAALVFRSPNQPSFQVRELRLVGGDRYEGVIPGKYVKPPAVEYYCYAVDFEGNRHIIFASEQQPQKIKVVTRKEAESGKPPEKVKEKAPEKGKKGEWKKTFDAERRSHPPADVDIATGQPEPVVRVPAVVSVLKRRVIVDSGAQILADVLDRLPGFHVSRSVSGDYRVAVRGVLSESEVLVLLDGHRLNDLYDGGAILEFPSEAIERIEVVRGPMSAIYGAGAFMSVVNVITRQATGFHALAGYGYFNTARVSAGGGHETKAYGIGGQVQFVFSQGQDRKVDSDVLSGVGEEAAEDDVSSTPGPVDDGRMQLHAQLHGSIKDVGGGELSLMSHYFFQSRGALVGKLDSLDRGSKLDLHFINVDIDYRLPILKNLEFDSRVYFDARMVDESFNVIRASGSNPYRTGDAVDLVDGLTESTSYRSFSVGTRVATIYRPISSNILTGGAQFEYLVLDSLALDRDPGGVTCPSGNLQIQGFMLPCGSTDGEAAGKDRVVFGAFIQDHWKDLLVKDLDFLAGFRLDYSTDFGLAYNPRVGVVYSPVDGLWLKSHYAMAFRAPTFKELYEDVGFDPLRGSAGNDGLDPVTIHTWEFGVEGHVKTRPVDFRLQANFFMSWISDSIISLDSGEGLPSYENIESLDIMGTEVEGVARFGERSRIFVNSSWFRAKVISTGERSSYINDIPQMQLNLGVDLGVLSWLNAHLGFSYGSERRNNVRKQLEMLRSFRIPAYTMVKVGLTTEPILLDHFVVFAFAYNVFDHDMRDPVPRPDRVPGLIPRAPFTFLVGLAWRP